MSTTQRSEGMNAFFDGFINSTIALKQFIIQYRSKAKKKIEADFGSLNTTYLVPLSHLLKGNSKKNARMQSLLKFSKS